MITAPTLNLGSANKAKIAFLAVMLTFYGAFAQAQASRPTPLWKVEKDGKISYLLGSMHNGVSANQLPDVVEKIFSSSTRVFFECDFAKIADLSHPSPPQPSPPPENVPLSKLLSKDAWKKLKAELGPRFTDANLDGLNPTSASWALARARDERMAKVPRIMALAAKVPRGMLDLELYMKAKEKGQRLGFLEDVQVASNLFESVKITPADFESEILLSEHDIESKTTKPLLDLILASESYVRGDIEIALRHLGEVSPDNAELNDKLIAEFLTARNLAWLPKIEAAHAVGSTVFVVGASHILGKDNLLSLLRARGYNIERVTTLDNCEGVLRTSSPKR